jgi:hypothetical protein
MELLNKAIKSKALAALAEECSALNLTFRPYKKCYASEILPKQSYCISEDLSLSIGPL